jgi:O-antigen/teichoic acid export membrane protein
MMALMRQGKVERGRDRGARELAFETSGKGVDIETARSLARERTAVGHDAGAADRGRQTAIGTLQNLGAQFVALSTGFATTVFLTRRLGPELYGEYSVAFGIVLWIELVAGSILGSTTVRLVAETDNWEAVLSRLAQIQTLISVGAAALLVAIAPTLAARLNAPGLGLYLRLYALEIPLFVLGSIHRSTLIGQCAFGRGAIVTVVYWLSRIALMLVLVGLGLSITGAVLANVGAAALQLAAARAFVRPNVLRGASARIPLRRIAHYALPLATHSMATLLYTKGDLLIVKASATVEGAAGLYGAANDLAMVPVSFLVGSAMSLLLATLTQMWEREQSVGAQSMVEQALRLALCLLPFAALASATAPGIVTLAYGDSYLPASPLLAVMSFAAVGYAVMSIGTRTLIASDRPGLVLVVTLALAALALPAYLILTPRFGPIGTAAARTAVTGLGAIVLLGFLGRNFGVRLSQATVWRTGLTTAIAYAASSLWQTSGLLVILELTVLSSGIVACLFLLGVLTERDLQFALSLLRPKPGWPNYSTDKEP